MPSQEPKSTEEGKIDIERGKRRRWGERDNGRTEGNRGGRKERTEGGREEEKE